jgi:RNA 3'-terminal phosphate cyclase (ATP)
MSSGVIDIDGSFGEGGGQILRSSLALSLLTGKPFRLRNVRANREKPGLQPQHLMSVRAAAAVGQAETRGASPGSTDLEFRPGAVKPGPYRFDIGTAGATSLVLHTVYLPLLLRADRASDLTLIGGTHVTKSPCYHFLETTWRRYLGLLGLHVGLTMDRPGFYPRGGGVVTTHLEPASRLKGLTLGQRGPVTVTGFSAVAGLPDHVARRQARRAAFRLQQRYGLDVDLPQVEWPGGPGSVLALVVETSPVPALFFGLGARGKPAERVADEAFEQAAAYLDAAPAAVDCHSADQLVLPLALAEGPSAYSVSEVTLHLTTNIAVVRRFVDRDIVCEGGEGEPGRVVIR